MKELALVLPDGTSIKPVSGMPTGGLLDHTLPLLLNLIFVGATVLALFLLIFGGIKWITSGGEKEGVENARKTIIYALIGLAVVFSSYFIVNTVGSLFGVHVFDCTYIAHGITICPKF